MRKADIISITVFVIAVIVGTVVIHESAHFLADPPPVTVPVVTS